MAAIFSPGGTALRGDRQRRDNPSTLLSILLKCKNKVGKGNQLLNCKQLYSKERVRRLQLFDFYVLLYSYLQICLELEHATKTYSRLGIFSAASVLNQVCELQHLMQHTRSVYVAVRGQRGAQPSTQICGNCQRGRNRVMYPNLRHAQLPQIWVLDWCMWPKEGNRHCSLAPSPQSLLQNGTKYYQQKCWHLHG